jgi:hypothetical protein
MQVESTVLGIRHRVDAFVSEAHSILSTCEDSISRVVTVDQTRKRIASLSILQASLLDEALECVRGGMFRAAHVLAWSAFIDYLEMKLASDELATIKELRPGWAKFKTMEELRDDIPESQIVDVARDAGLLTKGDKRIIDGLLAKRNKCAHPSTYSATLNESLGYVSELISWIRKLDNRQYP